MATYMKYEDGQWHTVTIIRRVHRHWFRRRNWWPTSLHCPVVPAAQWSSSAVTFQDTGRLSSHSTYPAASLGTHGFTHSLSRGSQSLDSGSRAYHHLHPSSSSTPSGGDVTMSRYSSRSLDLGSSRYDGVGSSSISSSSSSSYKSGLDPSSVGSYRSSNLSGYGSHGYGSRSDGRTSSYISSSTTSSSSSSASSGRLGHGSYSSRSSAVDSVPLPRASSFGRSEVLSSSTPRDQVEKGGYSSSLGRSSSIPTHTEDTRASRYSSRTSSALSSNHSLDSGSDAAAERRLRIAERRRQREERGHSETSSDTSKEPSVERASSLRRDSAESDSTDVLSSLRSRRLAARLQECSVAEEPSSKDSSPDVSDTAFRRSRRLRGSGGSSEDTASADSALGTDTRSSLRQRRHQQEGTEGSESRVTSTDGKDTERLLHMSAEARRARRQRRLEGLEAASKASGNQEEAEKNSSSSVTSSSSRSWRQRLQEEGFSGVSGGDSADDRKTRHTVRDEDQHQTQTEHTATRQDRAGGDTGRRHSGVGVSEDRPEDHRKAGDAPAAEVESRAERIARYKEERRKQLAHIASITSALGSEEKEGEAAPSLFTSAKRDKEGSPSEGAGRTAKAPTPDSEVSVSLTTRLRALRRDSQDSDSAVSAVDAQKVTSHMSSDVPRTSVTQRGGDCLTLSTDEGDGTEKVPPAVSDSKMGSSSSAVSLDHSSSSSKRQTTSSERPLPQSSGQTTSTRKSPLSESSGQQSSSHAPSPATETSVSSAARTASDRKTSTGTREPSPRKPSVPGLDLRTDRKPQDSAAALRKSKSPSPVSSRLMAPTKSSAAKVTPHTHTSTTPTSSPRSSVSPRGSPAPSDKQGPGRSAASGVSSTKGPPRIRPSLIPEHGAKDASTSRSSRSAAKDGEEKQARREDPAKDVGARQMKDRWSPGRQTGADTSTPKLSSSSFSTTSSTLSTDRDSGVGSTRLSSSSFSSTRSYDRGDNTGPGKTASSAKTARLQRTARVELSSSSSREGSEEKQLTANKPGQGKSVQQSSVKRTTSMPSRTATGDGQPPPPGPLPSTRQSLRSQARKPSSSSVEKEPSPPADVSVSHRSSKAKSEAQEGEGISTVGSSSTKMTPGSPQGNVGLDDLLAKNAEFLSSDEETSRGTGKERRRLREGEESRLRRSLRRKRSQRSGSSGGKVGPDSSEGESKDKKEEMEVATPTLTLPTPPAPSHSLVAEGQVVRLCPSPPLVKPPSTSTLATTTTSAATTTTAETAPPSQTSTDGVITISAPPSKGDPAKRDDNDEDASKGFSSSSSRRAEGGRGEDVGKEEVAAGRGAGGSSKEVSPDSDSVFHTASASAASSAPSSVEMPRRRVPQDKSQLRKSELNKAVSSSYPGAAASHSASHDRGRKGEEEVSDIRSRFSGGLSTDKSRPSDTSSKSTGVVRHASRGKEFSQLLSKFSSSSEASSSERSDTEGSQRRRATSFKRPADKEASSSSDDAKSRTSSRNIPERTQSLRVARPSPSGDEAREAEEKKVERAGSFKSDFMKKRFSPVPQSDAPSEELSAVLTRRHQEVEHQQLTHVTDTDLIADKRTAHAEQFKSSAIEEVIADSEVASVLKARRKKSESPEDSEAQPGHKPADQGELKHLKDKNDSSADTGSAAAAEPPSGSRKGSVERDRQSVSAADTHLTSTLQLKDTPHTGHTDRATKESSPESSARSDSPVTASLTLSLPADDKADNKAAVTASVGSGEVQFHKERSPKEEISTTSTAPEVSEIAVFTLTPQDVQVRKERDTSAEKETHKETQPPSSPAPAPAPAPAVASIDLKPSTDSTTTTSSALRRAHSQKQQAPVTRSESFERRKGILKRTPSLPKQEAPQPLIDPQLQAIMEQRRLKELETAKKDKEGDEGATGATSSIPARPRALSAAEEIEENIRHMRQIQQSKEGQAAQPSEEEAALCLPVADRIFHMQTKIEEVRHSPVTPKSRSGAATPRSARSWSSGNITPRKQVSVDEGVAEIIQEETTTPTPPTTTTKADTTTTTTTTTTSNDPRTPAEAEEEKVEEEQATGAELMERLNTLAANNAQFQERRQKFQKRHREDWRTRTQPVTMEEIQQADSLDTVSAFRAQVRRHASKNIFDHLKTQEQQRPLPAKGSEFPQHLTPEKRGGRRGRHQRHKTLPVTAEELNAIPEGELLEPVPLRETQELWKRDSRTDSGILSGSEAESLGSDSLRSLSLEMDLSDNDPSRLSVSSKTSLFKTLDERARQEREKEKSASGAKRYIDRKKRERSRTQPVTDDEVQTAAEMSGEEKKPAPVVKLPQPEVVNRPKSPSVDLQEEALPEEDDQLTKLSLAEKVKLFSKKQEEEREAAAAKVPPRAEGPVPKRRGRKFNSRYNTQPVTPEELEKASKISPLAMSLVKPPDPELLMGLKLKDQQELMMMHAEATLSQCSSRSGSRPSSQPGSRRGSFTTPENLAGSAEHEEDKKEEEGGVGVSERGPENITITTTTTTNTTTTTTTKKTAANGELTRTDSEPRGILKKAKSTESMPSDNNITATVSITAKAPPPGENATTVVSKPCEEEDTTSTAAAEGSPSPDKDTKKSEEEKKEEEDREEDRASPVAELILPVAAEAEEGSDSNGATATFFLADGEGLGGESSTDPAQHHALESSGDELEDGAGVAVGAKADRRRTRAADRKEKAERYLTQPAPQLTPERSPQTKRKYEGRHMTQPITPDEMKEAEFSTTPKPSGGSIADRLNQLKTSGEENWKKKVVKDKEMSPPVLDVKVREKMGLAAVRPLSISDRLGKLEVSAEQWKGKVEETDAVKFTVANKLSKSVVGSESPLVAKIKASSKKDLTGLDDSSNASSPVNSPSTPTKEFLPKVPLPKEIVADPGAVAKKEEKKKAKTEMKPAEEEEKGKQVRVEVPTLGDEEIEQFFSTKEITEIADKVDVEIDDFDNIFIESNDMLMPVRKIRPTRKKKATSLNPLKTVSQFVEIQTEYVQVTTGTAEKHLRLMKTEALRKDAGFAVEALAGLASKENFSQIELRKTEPSSLPSALAAQRKPFNDLMLLHIKGRRNVQTRLVEPSSKSMNAGDCYILVMNDKVINWVGEFSNIIEKAKSAEVASFIQQKKDLGCKSTAAVQTVDQVKDHLGAGKYFWEAVQGDKECQACGPEEEDELYESSIIKTNMVFRLEDGALKPYEKYWGAIPKHCMLNRKEVLVFDFGSEFYVWQGKEVSPEQRKQGMALGQKLWDKGYDYSKCAVNPMGPLRSEEDGGIPVQASKRPDWAIFGKINQNMETILFREKFSDWPDSSRLIGVKREKASEMKSEFADITAYDAKKMTPVNSSPVTLLLEGAHVGRGKKWQEDMQGFMKEQDILTLGIKVWHVMEFARYQMPEPSYGHFHCGDTYVVRWQYMITNAGLKSLKGQAARHSMTGRERCAYFFWQGQDSTISEKGVSALMTVELDEERGPQIRVVQGKEPPCFLNLFEGGMVIHIGKREDASTNTVGPWRLYCLRGDEEGEVCLLELPVSMANLRSRSSMVLLNTRTGITYVWHGVKSPQHHRQLAVCAVQNLKEKRPLELDLHKDAHIVITEVEEGEEKAEVWSALDSKDRSLYHCLLTDRTRYDYTPRLFHMTSVSMVFEVMEQMNPARLPGVTTPFPFFQSDLYKASQPALFLLDIGHCVYLWQGWWPVGDEDVENVHTGSATARYNVDRRCAMETTLNYCKERGSTGRTPQAFLVCAGVEPLAFQNMFPVWEVDCTVRNLALQDGKMDGYRESVEEVYIKLTQTRYTLEELQERPLPDGVDPLKLESYLADKEFEEVLEMKRAEFYALPTWKQSQIKQTVGLF
ncbi:uncharacterized protein LOC143282905 isoform X2 [Babylonia areolata]|uniref:uncharacterized protein LOC143282905 isoform X2 n=1 Tax=Babylonia areolata TaxID=304850 RepID=UPI003FD046CA